MATLLADVVGGVAVALARLLALETQALPLGGGGRDRAKSTQPHPEDTPDRAANPCARRAADRRGSGWRLFRNNLVAEGDALVADIDPRPGDQLLDLIFGLPAKGTPEIWKTAPSHTRTLLS